MQELDLDLQTYEEVSSNPKRPKFLARWKNSKRRGVYTKIWKYFIIKDGKFARFYLLLKINKILYEVLVMLVIFNYGYFIFGLLFFGLCFSTSI